MTTFEIISIILGVLSLLIALLMLFVTLFAFFNKKNEHK